MANDNAGYYRWPTVHGDTVVFASEDDLWEVPVAGGLARRLTSGLGEARETAFSPDGKLIAFCGTEEGSPEVFVMDARGGRPRQLTFHGAMRAGVVGWSKDGANIRFRSHHQQRSTREATILEVGRDGGEARSLGLGKAHWLWDQADGPGRVLGQNTDDIARWKRYRGGTRGRLWVAPEGDDWRPLHHDWSGGLCRPMWIGDRIWFISDEDGHGNLYSCRPDGADVRRHTDHEGFYARFAQTDGQTIVYTVAGALHRWDTQSDSGGPIEVEYASPRTQLNRKFVDADSYLEEYAPHPKGHSLLSVARGKVFNFGNWEGAVRQTGARQGVRYRLAEWIDADSYLVVSDEGGEERLERHRADGSAIEAIEHGDLGRAVELAVSPDGKSVAIANHRHELVWVSLESGETRVVDASRFQRIAGFDWSADSRWIAYSVFDHLSTSHIRIADATTWEIHPVTPMGYRDVEPKFDPKGRYLYFMAGRFLEPVYDSLFFDVNFPESTKPCVVTLRGDVDSPFFEKPRPLDGDEEDEEKKADKDEEESGDDAEPGAKKDGEDDEPAPEPIEIDFDGIQGRVEAFPVPVGYYTEPVAMDDRLFWLKAGGGPRSGPTTFSLQFFGLEKRSVETFAGGVDGYALAADTKTLVYSTKDGVRVVGASGDSAPDDSDEIGPSRKSGWIDLGRVRIDVEPSAEWRQMLRESWRLMRDHYWRGDLCGVDWEEVWGRYSGLLGRISSRSEFSDLVWVMQGELGTSHAYEFGGDYREPPRYRPGHLGADFSWDESSNGYRIDHVVDGASWERGESSPLRRPGLNVAAGDVVLAINGRSVERSVSLQEQLVHLAGQEVELTIGHADGSKEVCTVRTVASEDSARYREWVDSNRRAVHAATGGRVGYVHIPDMSAAGYAEFHRGFLGESHRDGLIVDVRSNGGGHVSQLILEKLARRRIGYDLGRWTDPIPYPEDSIAGPMVALTDEYAGSDGDIFSHCFKLMKLGPLIGKRTWGGVVGIWPRHPLVDGSVTTQPEFAFWFEDVGFGVENYGTEPDIEVDMPPGAVARGEDPQLEVALEKVEELLKQRPVQVPEFAPFPNFAAPRLGARQVGDE